MKKVCKKAGIWGILLGIMLFAVGFTLQATTVETQAAAITGFRTINGKTYYYKNGKGTGFIIAFGTMFEEYFMELAEIYLSEGMWHKIPEQDKKSADFFVEFENKGKAAGTRCSTD